MNLAALVIAGVLAAGGQPEGASDFEAPWADRLAALSPDDVQAYYRLGEEIADVAVKPEEVDLARRLYVIAFTLDGKRGRTSLSASVCLAMAQIERLESRKAWLEALAGTIDARYAANVWFEPARGDVDAELALKVATVMGYARSGEGVLAKRVLDEPGVRSVLEEYESLLGKTGFKGGYVRLMDYINSWPCPECGNERIVPVQGTDPIRYRVCFTCNGNPGPKLDSDELISQLRFESRLLAGIQRSWAAQVAADLGEPLRDPNPSDLAYVLGIDPTLVYWRDGKWVHGADAS